MRANASPIPESELLDAPDQAIEAAAPASRQCRRWLTWAAAQIEDCQRMDSTAMDTLVALLRPLIHASPDAHGASRRDVEEVPAATW